MFKLVKNPAHWWPIKWKSAVDGGKVADNEIELQMVRIGVAEFQAGWGKPPIGDQDTRERWTAWYLERFKECVRGWRNIVDDNGSTPAMTDENIVSLLDVPNVRQGFQDGYIGFWRAEADITLGNFEPSPAGGPATGDEATAGVTPPGGS